MSPVNNTFFFGCINKHFAAHNLRKRTTEKNEALSLGLPIDGTVSSQNRQTGSLLPRNNDVVADPNEYDVMLWQTWASKNPVTQCMNHWKCLGAKIFFLLWIEESRCFWCELMIFVHHSCARVRMSVHQSHQCVVQE